MQCIICESATTAAFDKSLNDQTVRYFECTTCGHLTATEVDADALYSQDEYFDLIDAGWERRNERILRYVNAAQALPGIKLKKGSEILDFGCGVGKLVDLLVEHGFEASGYEPFPNQPVTSLRIETDPAALDAMNGRFQLVTMVEVVEHLRDPDDVLDTVGDLLRPRGYLLTSTDLYRPGTHEDDWYYLNPAAGHVSIFTEASLRRLVQRHQFVPVFRMTQDVWLFRRTDGRGLDLDRLYFLPSQLRVRLTALS